jgi:uncharacterized protein YkwD
LRQQLRRTEGQTVSLLPNPGKSAAALVVVLALASPSQSDGRRDSYLAPSGYCDGASVQVMICLHDYARHQAGLPPLRSPVRLTRAARAKGADVVRCGFSHTACGHAFEYRINRAGYRWTRVGENLGFGHGSRGRPYAIFSSWMRSPRHRANILSPGLRDLGIAVRRGSFSGHSQASVWVAEFGSR